MLVWQLVVGVVTANQRAAVKGGSQSEGGRRSRDKVELTGELTNVGAAPASGHCQPGLASPLSSFHNQRTVL